jgi:hypothetical protein
MENHAVNKQEKRGGRREREKKRYNVLAAPRSSLFQLQAQGRPAKKTPSLFLLVIPCLWLKKRKRSLFLLKEWRVPKLFDPSRSSLSRKQNLASFPPVEPLRP